MKLNYGLSAPLLLLLGTALLSSAHAGSERLVMVMSPQKMTKYHLVHVRFKDAQGHDLHSDVMKRLTIRRGDCDTGRKLLMPEDYKFGFSPKKEMGIYLTPQVWKDSALCFDDPELGTLKTTISAKEMGLSVERAFK